MAENTNQRRLISAVDNSILMLVLGLLLLNTLIITSFSNPIVPFIGNGAENENSENGDNHPTMLSKAPNDELTEDKTWTRRALEVMWAERERMGRTPIHIFKPPGLPKTTIVFKNESASRTGSLKHRYAWALMNWALLEGHVKEGTHVFEASSGNTACSLAYMCKLLDIPFTAIVPDTLEDIKKSRIEGLGANIIKVPLSQRLVQAEEFAKKHNGFFMNQFKNAFSAEEFHESGNYAKQSANIFHEIINQLNETGIGVPNYLVHPAGTGGTITSIGRYVKKYGINTQIILADTQFSVYYDYVLHKSFTNESGSSQWIAPGMAGIGYGPMGPAMMGQTTSLDPAIIDRVLKIPDIASTAAMKVIEEYGISGGTSSGVNFLAAIHVAATHKQDTPIVISTILGDSGTYYQKSYLNRQWIADHFELHGGLRAYDCWREVIKECVEIGCDPLNYGEMKCNRNVLKAV